MTTPVDPNRVAGETRQAVRAVLERDVSTGDADESAADTYRSMVTAAAAGDRVAMRDLLVAVAPVVARAVRRVMGRGHPDVEDVAQQALAAFVDRLGTFRGECSVAHFAERIALYRALAARKAAGARQRRLVVTTQAELELSAEAVLPPDASSGQLRAALLEALCALPPPQMEALALHFLFDHTVAEIAAMTAVPFETVRSRLRHGKRELRARVKHDRRLAGLRETEE